MQSTIAIMQPYWLPYAGYFRLMAVADVFVVFDDVQFPRRGYVHRNRFLRADGTADWLTLPLAKSPRETKISEIQFHENAMELFSEQLQKFPQVRRENSAYELLTSAFEGLEGRVVDKLVPILELFKKLFGFTCDITLSSELLTEPLKGQDKIIATVKELGGTRYVNPPGGVDLYDDRVFSEHGIELSFLEPYRGVGLSIAEEILQGRAIESIWGDMNQQLELLKAN